SPLVASAAASGSRWVSDTSRGAAMEGLGRRGRAADEADGAAQETFPRRLRIRRRRDFLRVQRSGTKLHTRFFLVFVAPSALREPGGAGPASDPSSREQLPGTRLGVT